MLPQKFLGNAQELPSFSLNFQLVEALETWKGLFNLQILENQMRWSTTHGPGRSRTRALEDTVSRLEARLREYENPHETPSVSLHNPYGEPSESTALRLAVPSMPQPKGEPHSGHPSPPSPYSTLSPLTAPSPSSVSSNTSSIRTTSRSPAADSEEPSLPMIRLLLDTFYVHSSTFGFFLNMSRFSNDILTLPQGHLHRPCPGLLSTVYLLGVHLSTSEAPDARRIREQSLLLRALRDTATDLATTHPNRLLHTIQAETLLAYYFFRAGNILEAKRHASSAASLVLGCGLHRIRSSTNWSASSSPVSVGPGGVTSLPGARDAVEEGERINAFWTVFTLSRNLAVAVELSSEVCGMFDAPGMQVDTPWPLDMESYKEGVLPPAGASTIWNYLNHTHPQSDEYERSTSTFVTKTSILLHQAVFLDGQYHQNMTQKDSQAFYAAFQSLNHLIDTTRMQLPALPTPAMNADSTNPSTRPVYLSHALVQAATIKLHGILYSDPASRQVCLDAAKAMLKGPSDGGIDVQLLGSVNPIMGTLWTLSCRVLIDELVRVRSLRGQAWPTQSTAGDEDELVSRLHTGFAALNFFSGSSDLMTHKDPRGLLGGWVTEHNAYGESHGAASSASSPSSSTITSTTPLGSPGRAMQPAAVDDWSPRSTESSLSGDGSESSDHYQLHDQSSTLSTFFHPTGVVGYPNTHDTSVPRYGHDHTYEHNHQPEDYSHGQGQRRYASYSASSSPTNGQYVVHTPPLYDAPYTSLTVSY
uniref:Xylanolytic transcriptional activator regulatory domain-containing protein n=1 Tax=Moniliophthora roreri TaxID=221103 RepID=A0A0W0F4X5_MONRR